MYLARINISLKPAVNDPQGQAALAGLRLLGFESVADVRVGKYLEVQINESSQQVAEDLVNEMCQKLLANPVIEEFSFHLEEVTPVNDIAAWR